MVDGIAISVAGLQNAAVKVDKAARQIAGGATSSLPVDRIDITTGGGSAVAAAEIVAEGQLLAGIIGIKTAALLYKANAEALSAQLEAQKDLFEQLI